MFTAGLTAILLVFFTASSAHALLGIKYGVDVTVVSPMGDWGDGAGLGVGAMGRLEISIPGPLSLTARAGYIHHLEKKGISFNMIPMLLGAKFGFGLPGIGLYAYGEGGMFRVSGSYGGVSLPSKTELGMTLGVGASVGPLDARIGMVAPKLTDLLDGYGIMGTVGYNF
jgi:hypothetical protein